MIEMTPTHSMTDEQLEAWFAAAGLNVSVVEHCPSKDCPSCAGDSAPIAA
ncbi:MAG: hypothetical protein U9R47_03815 [Actinomycetota bacterium]|nr:hypothetical protein [Actinomycetota bacterium]